VPKNIEIIVTVANLLDTESREYITSLHKVKMNLVLILISPQWRLITNSLETNNLLSEYSKNVRELTNKRKGIV